MLKRYGRSDFPLLWPNFLDMRSEIYQHTSQNRTGKSSKPVPTKSVTTTKENLDYYLEREEAEVKAMQRSRYDVDQDDLDFVISTGLLPENVICERLCPVSGDKKACLKRNMAAKVIKSTIINECSTEEIVILLNDEKELQSMVSAISIKKNLEYDDFLVFCTAKTLVLDYASDNILTPNEAYIILQRFSPRLQSSVQS
jgi:hypothetical protein